jgi:hypothetical protein
MVKQALLAQTSSPLRVDEVEVLEKLRTASGSWEALCCFEARLPRLASEQRATLRAALKEYRLAPLAARPLWRLDYRAARSSVGGGAQWLEGILGFALLAPLDVAVLHRAIEVDGVPIDILEELEIERAIVYRRRNTGARLGRE